MNAGAFGQPMYLMYCVTQRGFAFPARKFSPLPFLPMRSTPQQQNEEAISHVIEHLPDEQAPAGALRGAPERDS